MITKRAMLAWPPERVAELRRLYEVEGLGPTAIAGEMGLGASVVIGKVRRLVLTPLRREQTMSASALQKAGMRPAKPCRIGAMKMVTPIVRPAAAPVMPEPRNIPLLDLKPNECRWPTSRVDGEHLFCAAVIGGGGKFGASYCAAHGAMARAPSRWVPTRGM